MSSGGGEQDRLSRGSGISAYTEIEQAFIGCDSLCDNVRQSLKVTFSLSTPLFQ